MEEIKQLIGLDEDSERKLRLINDPIECQMQISQHDNHSFIDLSKTEAKALAKELNNWVNQ